MCNTSTLLLVTLLATVLSTFPSPTTAQVGSSPWCQSYMANCEDLRKLNCDAKVPDNDRSMSWISVHCSTVTPSTGACKYFSPDCSCSYSDVENWNQTVWVPLGQPALERTQAQTNNGCLDANANTNSTASPTNATALPTNTTTTPAASTAPLATASTSVLTAITTTKAAGAATTSIAPTTTTKPNMAGDNKKPMAVSLATINVAVLIALFL